MRGMKWITKMVMEMVLVLAVVLIETPEGGWRRPPEVIPTAFPPLIFSGGSLLSLCFWFCVSPSPPSGKRRGTIFIVVFRSRGSFRKKDRRKRGHEGQKWWAHAAPVPGRVGHPLSPLRPPFACILRSEVFFLPKKNDPRKFSAHYDIIKALF